MRIELRGMTPLIQVFDMATSLMVMFAGTPYAHLHICGSPWEGNEYHSGDSEGSGQTNRTRHRNIQCAPWRRVLLYAELIRPEMVRRARMTGLCFLADFVQAVTRSATREEAGEVAGKNLDLCANRTCEVGMELATQASPYFTCPPLFVSLPRRNS
jgi:hypothetical protein